MIAHTEPKLRERKLVEDGRHSVLDGPEYIAGFETRMRKSVEEARARPGAVEACRSVLDGPACIAGVPHRSVDPELLQ